MTRKPSELNDEIARKITAFKKVFVPYPAQIRVHSDVTPVSHPAITRVRG